MAEETPVIAQYMGLKREHPGEVLFFRLGDFYEMFNDDAVEVSRLLNLTLTHRGDNPMCGVPYHASKVYISRLLRMGKKIAIAEQIGEVAKKGLTERKVVEVITPGIALESEYLDGGAANFLAASSVSGNTVGFAYIDITTGEFKATSFSKKTFAENFSKELGRCSPRELLLPESYRDNSSVKEILEGISGTTVSFYPDWQFNGQLAYTKLTKQFNTVNLNSFSLTEESAEVPPAGFLLDYLEKNTNTAVPHIGGISVYSDSQYVILDDSSRRNLEILYNLRDGTSQFSLFECVNKCRTSMGFRLLRQYLSFPLTDLKKIQARQNHVEFFVNDKNLLRKEREILGGILDIERLAGRIAMDKAHAKDLQALRMSLQLWLDARNLLSDNFNFSEDESLKKVIGLIADSIADDPSTVFAEGRVIREGWSEELDNWRNIQQNFNSILDEYVEEEKERTGIQNLRVKNTGNMGYYIEVTKGKLDKVPEHFIMKRALLNAERYTTEKLQGLEEKLNESSVKILELEHSLYIEVRNELKKYVSILQKVAAEIAYVDAAASFAETAIVNNWCRPELSEDEKFIVEDGRHPVVEEHIPRGEFVPNGLVLGCDENSSYKTFALITGPNMAGKSTFLRQNALISLLAQTGSFVPASKAQLGLVDRIFCRVGASDNLARGESTFLVEMTETARILRGATSRSLVIMDEVGRGTSTEDGLSIAWAISEYLLNTIKCKTLFATHYHELTRLEHNAVKLMCMSVNDSGNDVVFLRKVIEGASQNSYGVHVAKLAGIPDSVIERANEILGRIQNDAENKNLIPETKQTSAEVKQSYTGALFSEEEMILEEILSCDVDNMTPIAALQSLSRWKKTLSGR